MISASSLLAFITTCLIVESTPGPNMAYLAILSLQSGRRAGFFAVAGVALGLFSIGILAAMGMSTLIVSSPLAYALLRWGGVLYLLWLAWEGWRDADVSTSLAPSGFSKHMRFFRKGLIVNLLNPKAALFYIAILPEFITVSAPALPQAVFLTTLYVALATIIHILIVSGAASVRRFLDDPKRARRARRALSVALAGVAVWFALSSGQQ